MSSRASVHFTMAHTMSREDYDRLKELLLKFISEATQLAGPSKPEDVVALTCDLFEI